ncbi:hypothetical protein ACQP2Y_33875 [Actinoplanes sp. CA-051413]|uniref:hypothetical protein n=1 Tax=Actinoplanes sp. CA-051413 TaxID=3239899 RepID=UPI003D96BF6A
MALCRPSLMGRLVGRLPVVVVLLCRLLPVGRLPVVVVLPGRLLLVGRLPVVVLLLCRLLLLVGRLGGLRPGRLPVVVVALCRLLPLGRPRAVVVLLLLLLCRRLARPGLCPVGRCRPRAVLPGTRIPAAVRRIRDSLTSRASCPVGTSRAS